MRVSITDYPAEALAALKERAQDVCVVYREHPMPEQVTPRYARLGVGTAGLGFVLYIARDLAYGGDDPDVQAWVDSGTAYFRTFEEGVEWLRSILPEAGPATSGRPSPLRPAEVTSLGEVVVTPTAPAGVSEFDLRESFLASISGQDIALSQLASSVARHTSKTFPRRPYSAFLIGPTGTGKTESSVVLARCLDERSDAPWQFIRLDMAEFSEAIAVSRLVGTSAGYIGYKDGQNLAARLTANPRAVVLFDEIEKAHPAVIQALLGLLDTGRLGSDLNGATSASAILLFTSNLGASTLPQGASASATRRHLQSYGMSPELTARFTDVLTFEELSAPVLAEIAARAIGTVAGDYDVAVDWISPQYLSDILRRLEGNRLGARIVEYLVESDLGELLVSAAGRHVRVEFDEVPRVSEVVSQ